MGNTKKKDEDKKKKFSISMNEKLLDIFDEYLEEIDVSKRSRYIEKLVADDMAKRGKTIKPIF